MVAFWKSVAIDKVDKNSSNSTIVLQEKLLGIKKNSNLQGIYIYSWYCKITNLCSKWLMWAAYLLVLVGRDGGEDCLREAEGLYSLPARHWFVGRQFTAEVLPDDMNTRLILVHGVQDDLKIWKERRWSAATIIAITEVVWCPKKVELTPN